MNAFQQMQSTEKSERAARPLTNDLDNRNIAVIGRANARTTAKVT
jgi:hypothetical protein